MRHFGDITKISGYDAPPVDVVIGGSPCQDLSVAGKRAGLAGKRSSLFMEQVRLIKEMRDADRLRGRTAQLVRPRFMVWENVPGAFSTHKGEDFRIVLEETARVVCPDGVIPRPPGGKWRTSGCIMADRWSVAWRVLDAQFWGVPQRRRRIALVADFGGQAAPEILFIRKSVCGDSPKSGATRKGTAAGTESGAYPPIARSLTVRYDGQSRDAVLAFTQNQRNEVRDLHDVAGALAAEPGMKQQTFICKSGGQSRDTVFCIQGNCIGRSDTAGCDGKGWRENVSYTLNTVDRPAVYDARGNGNGETVPTITGDHGNRVTDYTALVMATGQANAEIAKDKSPALNCNHEAPIVAHALRAQGTDPHRADAMTYPITDGAVRRLTPLECERLQGFPDGWTDIAEFTDKFGKSHKLKGWMDEKGKWHKDADSPRYRALGNSIALPPWTWVLKRLCACYERSATMASLFDGIGGFPLIWERLNGPGSCLWASEIDAFCVAVTKERFQYETTK